MRFAVRQGLLGLVLPALAVLGVAASPASASPTAIVGHVYVNDNTTALNTIAAFNRHANGTLTPAPGSPFTAGGAGTGSDIASQGSLQQPSDHRYLIAVDGGSDQLSVLQILHDGALVPVPRGTVQSGGSDPVSVAVHGSLVYVANAGAGDTNYTGFRLGHDGRLRAIPHATFTLPAGSQPGDVLFNGSGTVLVGTRVASSQIDSFRVRRDGRLDPAPGSPFAAQGPGPFGSEFRPTDPEQLFVSNAHGGAGAGTVSAFGVAWNGALSSIGGSPFADQQTAPCWVEITHDGRFLFAINTASATISRYRISPGGSLSLLGSTPMRGQTGLAPQDARLSPDGRTLWVVDSGLDEVSGFSVDGGQLTEVGSSPTPLPVGAAPAGIVVN
ncbi:MAG TPA: beta-propeller fold lactonase family protein [Solirubrobacteraceae bacterium]|nr:beta-propeller fold lactonase family protein [Solirubrobacteraceae bacterium]